MCVYTYAHVNVWYSWSCRHLWDALLDTLGTGVQSQVLIIEQILGTTEATSILHIIVFLANKWRNENL